LVVWELISDFWPHDNILLWICVYSLCVKYNKKDIFERQGSSSPNETKKRLWPETVQLGAVIILNWLLSMMITYCLSF
jgi:hypothetical protein